MRVAFFQRVFAHYQAGLMKALTSSAVHTYNFYGENRDPLSSGIEPVSEDVRKMLPYTVCRTMHWGRHIAFQWKAIGLALFGREDVIILEGGSTILTNWPAAFIARLRGKRVLLYTHGWLRTERGMRKAVKNAFYRMASGLLLYSPRARAIGASYGFDPARMYVVYNSLDDETIRQYRQGIVAAVRSEFISEWFPAHPKDPMIVSVGRLNAAKAYPLLLEAVALLKSEGVTVTIMLVGEGPERPILAEQAAELGVPLVLPGARYDENFLSRAISSASMMVIPGAAGLSVIHSLSYGTPVVVHDDDDDQGPEVDAVKEGVNGSRFRRGSVEDLARAMRTVLERLPKTEEVERRCRAIVDEAYSPEQMKTMFDRAVSGIPAAAEQTESGVFNSEGALHRGRYHFCTYFDTNYYPRARTLYASLARQNVNFMLYALCLDEDSFVRVKKLGLDNFVPVAIGELEAHDPALARAKANRSKVEYYFTCTAAFCSYVMERFADADLLTYLDADLYFFDHPKPLFDELEGYSIGIIPHRYSLLASMHKQHGIYNVGWVSFRRDAEGMACLDLWRRQCIDWCYDRVEDGKFADQKYLDAWPRLFTRVRVIGHKGANVGSWNIANDGIRSVRGKLFVGGVPLIFFHFACFAQLSKRVFNTSFGGNYVFLTPTVRRHIYGPYIDDLLRFSSDDALAKRDRKADSHIQRIYQIALRALRMVRGIIFNEYIILPRDVAQQAERRNDVRALASVQEEARSHERRQRAIGDVILTHARRNDGDNQHDKQW